MSDYYVDVAGKTAGPFALDELRTMLRGGAISPSTLYTTPKSVEWLPLATIAPLLASDEPPAPPVADKAPLPMARPGYVVCDCCGHVGLPVSQIKGSLGVEILLWLFFLVPGLIYTVWRYSTRHNMCGACGKTALIPVECPKGRERVRLIEERGSLRTLFLVAGVFALLVLLILFAAGDVSGWLVLGIVGLGVGLKLSAVAVRRRRENRA